MKPLIRILTTFILTFFLSFSSLGIYVNVVELDPGESIGQDWYLLKSYDITEHEDSTTVSIKHGSGVVNISLVVAVLITVSYGIILLFRRHE